MLSRIDTVVAYVRGLGFEVSLIGPDLWLVRASDPRMPFISTEERITSANLIAVYGDAANPQKDLHQPTE